MSRLIETPGTQDDAGGTAAQLLARVGERVRHARALKGLPRRAVAQASGLSMRYLAALESGEGNISIGRLQRVALALDMPLDALVGEDDPWQSDTLRFAAAYRAATPEARRLAEAALAPAAPDGLRAARICLIGLRGAGKSTLGAKAAEALGLPFLELNREVEAHAGMPVTEIMALYGQEGYRRFEAQAVERAIAAHPAVIVAAAGGIVAERTTYDRVLAHFHTIWVTARPEDHMNRVRAQGDLRPMAGNPEAMEQLRAILNNREALYRRAPARLDTSGRAPEVSAGELVALIRARGFISDL